MKLTLLRVNQLNFLQHQTMTKDDLHLEGVSYLKPNLT